MLLEKLVCVTVFAEDPDRVIEDHILSHLKSDLLRDLHDIHA